MEYIVFKALGILGALVLVAMYVMIIWSGILKLKDFILERKYGKRFLYYKGRADAIEEYKKYLLSHKKLIREYKTNYVYEAVKIEFITDIDKNN